jgi:hypothetical protein
LRQSVTDKSDIAFSFGILSRIVRPPYLGDDKTGENAYDYDRHHQLDQGESSVCFSFH